MDRYTPGRILGGGALLLCFTVAASGQINQQTSPINVLPPPVARGDRETGTLTLTGPSKSTPTAVVPFDPSLLTAPQVNQFSPNQPFIISLQPKGNATGQTSTNASAIRSLWDTPGSGDWLASTLKNSPSALTSARPNASGFSLAQPARTPAVNWQQPPAQLPSFSSSPAPQQNWNAATDTATKGIKYQWQ